MENSQKLKISVVILSWNTKELLEQCLKSIPFSVEIIVVDNGSTDGSPLMVKKEFPKVKLIENQTNLGFAKGNNQGIRKASGDLIMLLNSDTIVQRGAIEKLVSGLINQTDKIGAVSPMLILPNGKPQIEYFMKFPNLWQVFLYHNPVLRPLVMRTPLRWLIVSRTEEAQPFGVDQLPGAALMVSREVWEKAGFLDEDYQFLYEDVDWCWRAKKLGYKLMVVPEAKMVHIGGASWKQKVKKDSYEFYRQYFSSLLLFVKKNYTTPYGLYNHSDYGEAKFRIFRVALVINFLITLKFKLAWWFLINPLGKQEKLWE